MEILIRACLGVLGVHYLGVITLGLGFVLEDMAVWESAYLGIWACLVVLGVHGAIP
jgi:hypothetical protein